MKYHPVASYQDQEFLSGQNVTTRKVSALDPKTTRPWELLASLLVPFANQCQTFPTRSTVIQQLVLSFCEGIFTVLSSYFSVLFDQPKQVSLESFFSGFFCTSFLHPPHLFFFFFPPHICFKIWIPEWNQSPQHSARMYIIKKTQATLQESRQHAAVTNI